MRFCGSSYGQKDRFRYLVQQFSKSFVNSIYLWITFAGNLFEIQNFQIRKIESICKLVIVSLSKTNDFLQVKFIIYRTTCAKNIQRLIAKILETVELRNNRHRSLNHLFIFCKFFFQNEINGIYQLFAYCQSKSRRDLSQQTDQATLFLYHRVNILNGFFIEQVIVKNETVQFILSLDLERFDLVKLRIFEAISFVVISNETLLEIFECSVLDTLNIVLMHLHLKANIS